MIFTNVTREELERALAEVNDIFAGNVKWKESGPVPLNKRGDRWRATLKVKSCSKPGHRRHFSFDGKERRGASACWHVHGCLFDALPDGAEVITGRTRTGPGRRWRDWNVGSESSPCRYSKSCDCATDGTVEKLRPIRIKWEV